MEAPEHRLRASVQLAGFSAVEDRLTARRDREPLPPHNIIFGVPGEELEASFTDLAAAEQLLMTPVSAWLISLQRQR